jgi:cyclic-di-AMP phosphodiesterase PgpH
MALPAHDGISLLELTDMSHPLLQRLALEAPGTYHHSLMVGAIGQAAANRIGADGLLVRSAPISTTSASWPSPSSSTKTSAAGRIPTTTSRRA